MTILSELSSASRDRTATANRAVAARCIAEPGLLAEVVSGLSEGPVAVVADCAEVCTMVAESRPDYVAPYAELISPLLAHRHTRVRWEATHAIALIAAFVPGAIEPLLPRLAEMISGDTSVIVRDYAVDAVANYAKSSDKAAEHAYPMLRAAVTLRGGKHAHHALPGLCSVAQTVPSEVALVTGMAQGCLADSRPVVRKVAKAVLRVLEESVRASRDE